MDTERGVAKKKERRGAGRGALRKIFGRGVLARKFLIIVVACVIGGIYLSGLWKKGAAEKGSPHYRKAVEAYRQGDYEKAVSLFKKASVYDPLNAQVYLDIAAIYDDFLGDASKAIEYYEKYLRLAGEGEMAEWVRVWVTAAKRRLARVAEHEEPRETVAEAPAEKDKMIESLREQLQTERQALAQEKEKTASVSKEVASLEARLSAELKEKERLQRRLAAYTDGARDEVGEKRKGGLAGSGGRAAQGERGPISMGWILCVALGVVVIALIIKQRYASAKEKALLAGIEAAASGSSEEIRKDDILGKYFWVENERNAGILTFSEKDGEIHACAIDGTTKLRSRGKGKLIGNVLSAELHSAGGEGVVTKFIFANKGRTVTAVWQGDEGTSVAAGTKAVED